MYWTLNPSFLCQTLQVLSDNKGIWRQRHRKMPVVIQSSPALSEPLVMLCTCLATNMSASWHIRHTRYAPGRKIDSDARKDTNSKLRRSEQHRLGRLFKEFIAQSKAACTGRSNARRTTKSINFFFRQISTSSRRFRQISTSSRRFNAED